MKRRGSEHGISGVPLFRIASVESFNSPIDRRADYYRLTALENLRAKGSAVVRPFNNVPNALTLSRVVMVPLFVATWFSSSPSAPTMAASIFILASLTDWLDGYLARRLQLTSAFGAFLDPVADKIMVSTALILLASQPLAPVTAEEMLIPVALMISREITMSALREWAAAWSNEAHKAVKVNSLGKWKTALQMTSMIALLVLRCFESVPGVGYEKEIYACVRAALFIFWASAILALWSLFNYMACVWKFLAPAGVASTANKES